MNAEEAPIAMSQLGHSVKHQVTKMNDRLKKREMNTGVINIIIQTVLIQSRRRRGPREINLSNTICHCINNAL